MGRYRVTSRDKPHDNYFDMAPKRHMPGQKPKRGGAGSAYAPPPHVLRQMHAIDPNLGLEWRPWGVWSKTEPMGCWRITVKCSNGRIRGLRMWPPTCADGRLIHFLENTWQRSLFIERSHLVNPGARMRDMVAEVEKAEAQEKKNIADEKWNKIDHGIMYRASRARHEGEKWRLNHAVPGQIQQKAD